MAVMVPIIRLANSVQYRDNYLKNRYYGTTQPARAQWATFRSLLVAS